jgi:hypothetical protein
MIPYFILSSASGKVLLATTLKDGFAFIRTNMRKTNAALSYIHRSFQQAYVLGRGFR